MGQEMARLVWAPFFSEIWVRTPESPRRSSHGDRAPPRWSLIR
jgi:hypothetical protein